MTDRQDYLSSFFSGISWDYYYCYQGELLQLPQNQSLLRLTELKFYFWFKSNPINSFQRPVKDNSNTKKQLKTLFTSIKLTEFQIFGEGIQPIFFECFPKELLISPLLISFGKFNHFITILFKRFTKGREDKSLKRKFQLFLCGFTAGILSAGTTYPFDLLRVRMAMQKDFFYYSSFFNAVNKIYSSEGPRGFFSGIAVALSGVGVYQGSGFLFFTLFKEWLFEVYPQIARNKSTDFFVGGVCSVCAQLLAYPFDIVKKRVQGQRILFNQGEITHIKNATQLVKSIYKYEGIIKGFYKGVSLNLIKSPIQVGTSWTVKNALHRKFNKQYDL